MSGAKRDRSPVRMAWSMTRLMARGTATTVDIQTSAPAMPAAAVRG